MVKLKFDIDKSGLLTLFIHLLASVIRLTNTFIGIKLGIIYVLQSIVGNLIWFSLYYFICELNLIQKHLEAEDHETFFHAKSQIKRKKLIAGIILTIYALASSVIYYTTFNNVETYIFYLQFFHILLIVARTIKITLDIYFHILFIQMLIFMIGQRTKKTLARRLSFFNQAILFHVIFLYTFSFFNVLLIFGATFHQVFVKNYTQTSFFYFIEVMVFLVFPIKDSIIALSLSYMYYS